ncbi:MAG TPA: hypothetical protein PLR99_23425 [Polyangiaceae bacterium]|nr:hypothetical protein [Polyangiaceae bacterium]
MNQSTSAHSAPGLLAATARVTALVLGASLGFVGLLCGAMVVAAATLDAKPASATPATTAPSGDAPRALDGQPAPLAPRAASAKKPRSSI